MCEEKRELVLDSKEINGVFQVSNYDEILANLQDILCTDYKVFKITNEDEYRELKDKRARLNKVIESIDRRRIDTIEELTKTYEYQCRQLKNIVNERKLELAQEIKIWADSKKEVVVDTKKKITATIKYYDEKISKKLEDFCRKNGCELTIK